MQINKAVNKPALLELEKGKTYAWFSFRHSTNQLWCNGSHKESGFTPRVFHAEESRTSDLCLFKGLQIQGFVTGRIQNKNI